ncbi:MAG: HNH endonuclease [Nitrospirae bacterium]|nr:HNH endonuclease [Nitrospirota bacterium]
MKKWSRRELIVAFNLYCQMPFGKIHSRNPIIMQVAKQLNRTSSSVAMKMLNFASLDPIITDSGRHGLGNASNADREVWEEFHRDWENLALEGQLYLHRANVFSSKELPQIEATDFTGKTKKATVEVRLKQSFFRQAVLSSYQARCCMTGLADPRLLVASHIIPWSQDKANRLNPSNGLCLSALHDKAFDQGLITVLPNWEIRVSKHLDGSKNAFCKMAIVFLEGKKIKLPEKFLPMIEFLDYHNKNIFIS